MGGQFKTGFIVALGVLVAIVVVGFATKLLK